MDFDFGYGQNESVDNNTPAGGNATNESITDIDSGTISHDSNGEPVDDIDDKSVDTKDSNTDNKDSNKDTEDANTDSKEVTLQEGTSIEVGDETYTVDNNGNILDKNGNVFKEASEAQDWIKSFDTIDDAEDGISLQSIQDAIGVSIQDENGKDVEFENTPAGVKSYVDSVIETAKQEHYEAAINTFYQRYPFIPDIINYYVANGNSLDGYGEVTDRSGVTIDDTNEAQQEAIIRTAWVEQNRKGDIDNYINYLKTSGILLATAKEELAGLQEADAQYKKQLADEATRKEEEQIKMLEEYWNGVHDIIKTRQIAGYQIPDNIIINRNGQKISVTPEDFFNYIYRVDDNGKSAYEYDLAKQDAIARRDDEILRAYLKFVGGNYSNLVDMAINKKKVETLRLKAKERNTSTIRINKPKAKTANGVNIDLGYN